MTAPDFVEPIVGYRAWHVEHGELVPWSAGRAGAWAPGVNEARCLHLGGKAGHRAPVADCSCGLYALADARDDRLHPEQEAVGAIVAWGDVEVHRTGFRAQYAAVVALALPEDEAAHLRRLKEAAQRYGVPLVPAGRLADAALEYGRPVAYDAIAPRPPSRAHDRSQPPPLTQTGVAGIAVEDHVTITLGANGVTVAPTDALRDALPDDAAIEPPSLGAPVHLGDVLLSTSGDDGLTVRTPISGFLADFDERTLTVTIRPSNWTAEGRNVAWGKAARRFYAALLADLATKEGDPFAHLRTRWLHAHARIRSGADVLQALRDERTRPRFADERDLYDRLGRRLEAALEQPAVARAASRASTSFAWRLHRPDGDVVIDCTGTTPRVATGERDAEIVLFASAETADDYFAGRLDLAAALRRRDVQSTAPPAAILRAASVLKPLHAAY